MADRYMNDFKTASDAVYIYAEAADGSQIRMLKADFMNLISGHFPQIENRIIIEDIGIPPGEERNATWRKGLYMFSVDINPGIAVASFGSTDRPDAKPQEVSNNTSGAIAFVKSSGAYLNIDVKQAGIINIKNNNNSLFITLRSLCLVL